MGLLSMSAGAKSRGVMVAEVLGGCGAMGYANHKFGAGEIKLGAAADGSGGLPMDGSLGLAGILAGFVKPNAAWATHAMNLGLGAGCAFMYRTAAAAGDKASLPKPASTAGRTAAFPAPRVPAAFGPFAPQVAQPIAQPSHVRAAR